MIGEQVVEIDLMTSGDFESDGKVFSITMSGSGLRWELKSGKAKTHTNLELQWCDVIAVHQGRQPSKTVGDNPDNSFTLHYIFHQPGKHWRHQQKVFTSKDGNCHEWVNKIEEKHKIGKAQNVLVIINPVGGDKKGRQIYEKKVAPLFALAGIKTDVIVTERKKHGEEIIQTYDLSTVDSVVVAGGDGQYQEILNAVLLRTQKDAGKNINSPRSPVATPAVQFGLLPLGTVNMACLWACDHIFKDVETAALIIVRGQTHGYNVMSIHELVSGKLLAYGGLGFGHGYITDFIKHFEDRREMRTFRFPAAILAAARSKLRSYVAEIELLLDQQDESSHCQSEGGATAQETETWKKLEKVEIRDAFAYVAELGVWEEKLCMNPSSTAMTVLLQKPLGKLDYYKLFVKLPLLSKDILTLNSITTLKNVKGFRLKTCEKEGVPGPEREYERKREKFMNIDGEALILEKPEFEIRLHSKAIQMFSTKPITPESPSTQ